MLLKNATIATMTGDAPYGLIKQGAVSIDGGEIRWVGPEAELARASGRAGRGHAGPA